MGVDFSFFLLLLEQTSIEIGDPNQERGVHAIPLVPLHPHQLVSMGSLRNYKDGPLHHSKQILCSPIS